MIPKEDLLKSMLLIQMTLTEIKNLLHRKKGKKKELDTQSLSYNQWLDKQQVLQMLHISDRTLYSMRKGGLLNSYSIKGKMYFRREEIEQLLASGGS